MKKKEYSKENPPPLWADRQARIEFESGWHKVRDGWLLKMPDRSLQHNLNIWASFLSHECQEGKFRACSAIQSHKGKKKFGIYAYCSNCKAKLPEQIKSLIRLAMQ